MSENPPTTPDTAPPVAEHPGWTEADREAMFASVVWFRADAPPELTDKYIGMYVAIHGQQVLDGDRDEAALLRRVAALGDTINQNRVVIQYLPTWEESQYR
ncbi:MAG: hypothetical protein C0501_24785 [Isosphaera sp.]|nr:hypothetical protein [Isosphaera sp.]